MEKLIIKKSFQVAKTEKVKDGWHVYPKGGGQPVFLYPPYFNGELLEISDSLWSRIFKRKQLHTFCYWSILDFVFAAHLDSTTLFQVPAEKYPKHIKLWIEENKKLELKIKTKEAELQEAIQKYVDNYVDYENLWKINHLALPLRTYLNLHLQMEDTHGENTSKICFMIRLAQIAEDVYGKRVDVKSGFDKFDFFKNHFLWLAVETGNTIWYEPWQKQLVEAPEKYSVQDCDYPFETWQHYRELTTYQKKMFTEIEEKIAQMLPKANDEKLQLLKNYSHFVVREILSLMGDDYRKLHFGLAHGFWGERLLSDEAEYAKHITEMKLLKYSNFILPQSPTDEQITFFANHYNLN